MVTAEITVDGDTIEREVCSVTLRTRAEGGNTVRLAGGIELRVDDEFAATVGNAYYDES